MGKQISMLPQQMIQGSDLAAEVAAYLDSCRARGLSPKTVERAYALPLTRDFLPFLEREGIMEVAAVDQRVIDRFSTQLLKAGRSGRKLSPYSVTAYLRPVNQFLNWARKEGAAGSGKAQFPKRRKLAVDPLTKEEVDRLEAAAGHERDKLIIRLLAETGAREGEIANLKTAGLIVRERRYFVAVDGKTGPRHPAISAALYGRLRAYRDHSRGRDCADDTLFTSLTRVKGKRYGLTETGIYQAVKEAAAKAGIEKRVYVHLFRHTAITNMIREGVSAFAIADNCGVGLGVIQNVYSHMGLDARWDALFKD